MAKTAFNRKKALHQQILDLNLRKMLVKCYTRSLAFYVAENRRVDQKYLGSFQMWFWRRIEKIRWTDRVRNGEMFQG
jgi:hypothetical protein